MTATAHPMLADWRLAHLSFIVIIEPYPCRVTQADTSGTFTIWPLSR